MIAILFDKLVELFVCFGVVSRFFGRDGAVVTRVGVHFGVEVAALDAREEAACAFEIARLVERHGEEVVESRGVCGAFFEAEAFEESVASLLEVFVVIEHDAVVEGVFGEFPADLVDAMCE